MSSLNNLILTTLQEVGAPVEYMDYTGDEDTYIRFFEYDNESGLEADDEEQYSVHYVHLDIFSPWNYQDLVKKVKQKMKQAGFVKNAETEMYEEDTKLYHKALRFYLITKTEED